ncbi:MAG: type II toxin-antitoxin system VapC family toxin [Proteobacteria bacterium]|nr:type II toxin-antitoxin system VapC family toxin [Pseudomonadota bacterium]
MKLLLDTHALLWWIFDDARLSSVARALIAGPENEVFVSAASGWEIATKHRLGKLPKAGDVAADLSRYLRVGRITSLPIAMEHALAAGRLPGPHRDPFDRMLIAQAMIDRLPVVTADPVFMQYGADVRW